MSLQQFEQIQSQIVKLAPEQLMLLQSQIASNLAKIKEQEPPLITEEELTMISNLFN